MTFNFISKALMAAACTLCIGAQAQSVKHVYAYKDGVVVLRANVSDADSVALEENKSVVAFYNHSTGQKTYSANYSDIDSISFTPPYPVADLLDVKFDETGTCWDNSPMGLAITPLSSVDTADVDYNKTYETYEGHFQASSWGGTPQPGCFKAGFSQNDYFKEALGNGHTLECLFKLDYEGDIPDKEAKWFSAMQGGGTGFLICTKSHGKNGTNEITFLPNVTQNGNSNWIWATSGVVPQSGKYYHVVGVWNQEEGKAYIYVNGQLMNTVDAVGDLRFPSSESAQWFGIGCDANTGSGDQACDSHIAIARVYDKALTPSEVDGLWKAVADKAAVPVADLLDVKFTADGSAEDISPMQNNIEVVSPTNKIETYYNNNFGTYAAKINNTWGGKVADTNTYCKVDFENNQKFRDALANGHTVETLWKATYTAPIADKEAKWFSAMQGGGTGFLICTKARGKNGENELTFLPNVTQNGKSNWIWATSGVVPQPETYYHLVGVWNQEEGKAYVYVNGELMNTVDAVGDLRFASSGANWWGIGCDANPSGGEAGGNWEIVNARVYDNPLTEHQVSNLWNNIASAVKLADDSVAEHQVKPEDTITVEAPKADLMDIEFGAAGEVKDVAIPAHNPQWMENEEMTDSCVTYFNSDYNRYVARLDNNYGSAAKEYILGYDYESDQAFKDSLSDGHSLEILVMQDNGSNGNLEVKPFSSHQGGGTGLMLERSGDFTFLPHVGGGYKWATSGITPEQGKYYHVVGVWNKEEGKAYIYVDGELRNTVDASGNFQFASSGNMRLLLGADPDGNSYKSNNGWKGDIVIARAYSAPLSKAQVKALYKQIEDTKAAAPSFITNCSYAQNLAVKPGSTFNITGTGFVASDSIAIVKGTEGLSEKVTLPVTLTSDGVSISMPEVKNGSRYYIYVVRGGQLQTLGTCKFYVPTEYSKGSKVVAHRGYWNVSGASQNSVASLNNAINLHCAKSETDVWITTDGHIMVNHDPSFNGVTIKSSTYDQCKDLTLSNGEKMPQLQDFLSIIKNEDWVNDTTMLIIEIKDHGDSALNVLAAQTVVAAVDEADVADRVEYISFSTVACEAVIDEDNNAHVSYLGGDISPQELFDRGYRGMSYTLSAYKNNPTWIQEAMDLEMTTNVWTLDSTDDIVEANNLGIEYITTNNPVEAQEVEAYYKSLNE